MLLIKTTRQIIDDWDTFRDEQMQNDINWRNKHYEYMNVKWATVNEQEKVWNNFIENNHFSICESGDHNMVDIMTMKDLKILKEMLFGRN